MYQILPGAVVGASVLGVQVAASNGTVGAAATQIAQKTLPFTGFAYGLYLALAMSLLVVGFIMRFAAGRNPA